MNSSDLEVNLFSLDSVVHALVVIRALGLLEDLCYLRTEWGQVAGRAHTTKETSLKIQHASSVCSFVYRCRSTSALLRTLEISLPCVLDVLYMLNSLCSFQPPCQITQCTDGVLVCVCLDLLLIACQTEFEKVQTYGAFISERAVKRERDGEKKEGGGGGERGGLFFGFSASVIKLSHVKDRWSWCPVCIFVCMCV